MKTVRINTLLVVSIMLTITSALITHYAARESGERVEIVLETQQVIGTSESLFSQLKYAEIHYRDFLLFHDSSHIENFKTACREAEQNLRHLRQFVTDTEQLQLLEATVVPVAEEKIKRLKESIVAAVPTFTSEDLTSMRIIYPFPDSLRETLNRFTSRQQELLNARMDVLQGALSTQRKIRYICFILIGLTSALALVTLNKKEKHNIQLIKQLHTTNATLEDKINERTAELERKNLLAEKLNKDIHENFKTLELFYEALQIKNIKTQDTLREIQYLYDNANCGYHSLDAAGIVIRINQTELNWLGYKREEVVGKVALRDILIPEEYAVFDKKFDQFLKEGVVRNIKHHYQRKDGTTFPVLINSTAIYDKDNNFVMSRATVVDITDQEEAEKKLIIFNQKLKALNEEKDNFLGAAAHDLKSPLNGILGLIHLLKIKNENLTLEQREYLHHIEQSCSSMKMMVTNLLDINRIEQGYSTLNLARFSLRELLQHQVKLYKELADKKGITIVLEDNNEEIFMYSDNALVSRVCDNLISNALKFSYLRGSVWIKVMLFEQNVVIDVIDRGPGIRKEEIALLFNKFKKLSTRPTAGESSTGLGLSIVKELVQLLQGKISVISEEKVGTTFTVELPLNIDTAKILEPA
jgi:PAS domain S-box-containing protein